MFIVIIQELYIILLTYVVRKNLVVDNSGHFVFITINTSCLIGLYLANSHGTPIFNRKVKAFVSCKLTAINNSDGIESVQKA